MRLFFIFVLTFVVTSTPCLSKASDYNNSRTKIIDFLNDAVSSNLILSGQNAGHMDGIDEIRPLEDVWLATGTWPAVIGADIGYGDIGRASPYVIDKIISYGRKGGIVTLSMHPGNPFTGGDAWDVKRKSLKSLLVPGTEANTRWITVLDNISEVLEKFHRAGIVVLWRPFHEMNGNWFWWGFNPSRGVEAEEFIKLWSHMHEYLTRVKGLDNLLWVYSPNCRMYDDIPVLPVNTYYPGDHFVDIVGLDCYTDDIRMIGNFGSYNDLLIHDKPLALTEFGPQKRRNGSFDNRSMIALHYLYPRFSYFLYWHSYRRSNMAIADQVFAREMMTDKSILNRANIP